MVAFRDHVYRDYEVEIVHRDGRRTTTVVLAAEGPRDAEIRASDMNPHAASIGAAKLWPRPKPGDA